MKNSKEFKDWQNDLLFLSHFYNINPSNNLKERADIFSQIIQTAVTIPAEIKKRVDNETGESLMHFLKTTGDSVLELYNLLKITLNLNLITIDEYHSLITSLNDIGDILNKFLSQYSLDQKHQGIKPGVHLEDLAFWTLN